MDAHSLEPKPLTKDEQLTLAAIAGPDDGGAFSKLEGRHEFTGERLLVQRPQDYRAILKLIGRGFTHQEIADVLEVSPGTVRAVLRREDIAVGLAKETMGMACMDVGGLCLTGMREKLGTKAQRDLVPLRDLAVAGGILIDKGLLLAGEATIRLDHRVTVDGEDPYGAFLASMGRRGTGWSEGNPGQKELGPGVPALPEAGSAPT